MIKSCGNMGKILNIGVTYFVLLCLFAKAHSYKPDVCEKAYEMYFPYKKTFSSACIQLDHCYQHKQASRSDCDVAFHYDLVMQCLHNRETPYGTFPYNTCLKIASLYHKAVRKYGQSYYG